MSEDDTVDGSVLPDLVNRLAQELTEVRAPCPPHSTNSAPQPACWKFEHRNSPKHAPR
jgi:hypothetical protein